MAAVGVPGAGTGSRKVWRIDGIYYLIYYAPEKLKQKVPGIKGVPMAWRMDKDARIAIFGTATPKVQKTLSKAEARRRGIIWNGTTDELRNMQKDPWTSIVSSFSVEAKIRPWLRNPEILGRILSATLEGRDASDAEIQSTEYWQSRTQAQRDWAGLVASDPKTALQRVEDARIQTRDALRQFGMRTPSSLVNYLADMYAHGDISQTEWQYRIRAAADPYAPGATAYSGITLKDLPTGQAREYFGSIANIRALDTSQAPTGTLYQLEDGTYGLRLAEAGQDPRWLSVSKGAELEALREVYGEEAQYGANINSKRFGAWSVVTDGKRLAIRTPDGDYQVKGTGAQSRFGGIKGAKKVSNLKIVGDASTIMGQIRTENMTTGLGQEEDVYQLLLYWLGPMLAKNYDNKWIQQWAGRIRSNPNAREQLVESLRSVADTQWGEKYGPGKAYADVAAVPRAMFREIWGEAPDETNALFMQILRMNDEQMAAQKLRQVGLQQGKKTVVQQALRGVVSSPNDRRIAAPMRTAA